MKTGILGGTFNPIHSGHLHLARCYREALALDRVLLIPTNVPPHKLAEDLADGTDRLAMCSLAIEGETGLSVDPRELHRPGRSFTADTLEELAAAFPDDEFFLLMGSDMFLTVESWHRAPALFSGATLCTAPRNPGELERLQAHAHHLAETHGARCRVVDIPPHPVSSTQIRAELRAGNALLERLPPQVEDYIRQNGLYGTDPEDYPWPLEEYRALAERLETPKRYAHSLAVARQAAALAERHGAPVKLAQVAGLLHDICKDLPEEEQLQRILKSVIIWDTLILELPNIWHGIAGAAYLTCELNLKNRQILDAVGYHTTGRGGMSPLEKIIYLADLTSEDRAFADVEELRRTVEHSLDAGMKRALTFTARQLAARKIPLTGDTINACREYGVPL